MIDDAALYDRSYFSGFYENDAKREKQYQQRLDEAVQRLNDANAQIQHG